MVLYTGQAVSFPTRHQLTLVDTTYRLDVLDAYAHEDEDEDEDDDEAKK